MQVASNTGEVHTENELPLPADSSTAGLHNSEDLLDSNMSKRQDFEGEKEMRLLVVGKTGNGKSALCNTILGQDKFETGCSMSSTTLAAQAGTTVREGIILKVVDTPDVSNLEMTQQQTDEEVASWKSLTQPSPTAILLAVRCDVRYTAEEYAVYRQLCKLLEGSFVKNRLVVAFTFGDRQDGDIEEELKTLCPELKKVLNDASWRYVVFENKANEATKTLMVQKLLEKLTEISASASESLSQLWMVLRQLLGGIESSFMKLWDCILACWYKSQGYRQNTPRTA